MHVDCLVILVSLAEYNLLLNPLESTHKAALETLKLTSKFVQRCSKLTMCVYYKCRSAFDKRKVQSRNEKLNNNCNRTQTEKRHTSLILKTRKYSSLTNFLLFYFMIFFFLLFNRIERNLFT